MTRTKANKRGNNMAKSKAMKIHPLCRMFGSLAPMSKDELADLRADIEQHGIKVPILVNKKRDTILDGATRWGIAYDLKLQDVVRKGAEVFAGKDDEIEGEILSRNLYRRHMTDKERSDIVSKILGPKLEKEAKERQSAAGSFKEKQDGAGGTSVAQLAKVARVGVHTAKQSEKLRKAGVLDDVIQKKTPRKDALKKAGTKRRKPLKPKKEPPFEDVVYKKWTAWLNKFESRKRRVMELVHGWIGCPHAQKNGNGKK